MKKIIFISKFYKISYHFLDKINYKNKNELTRRSCENLLFINVVKNNNPVTETLAAFCCINNSKFK